MGSARVLWVDDDNDDLRLLAGLELFFKAKDVHPIRAQGYVDGSRELRKVTQALATGESLTLLTDVILPQVLGRGALAWNLGLRLALEAADLGVRRVCFLTTVQREEIEEGWKHLEASDCRVQLISKLELFEGDNIQRLVQFVTEV